MSLMTIAHHSTVDLNWQSLLSTIVYAVLGVVLLMVFALLVNRIFRLDLRRELIEDQNIGLGLAFAGTALAIAIIIAATLRVRGVSSIGRRSVAISSLRSADARASGSCVNIAPSSSASNSRVRDSENWISIDTKGAMMLIARRPRKTTPPPSRRFPPPKKSSPCAIDVIRPPIAAATDVVRMSRL